MKKYLTLFLISLMTIIFIFNIDNSFVRADNLAETIEEKTFISTLEPNTFDLNPLNGSIKKEEVLSPSYSKKMDSSMYEQRVSSVKKEGFSKILDNKHLKIYSGLEDTDMLLTIDKDYNVEIDITNYNKKETISTSLSKKENDLFLISRSGNKKPLQYLDNSVVYFIKESEPTNFEIKMIAIDFSGNYMIESSLKNNKNKVIIEHKLYNLTDRTENISLLYDKTYDNVLTESDKKRTNITVSPLPNTEGLELSEKIDDSTLKKQLSLSDDMIKSNKATLTYKNNETAIIDTPMPETENDVLFSNVLIQSTDTQIKANEEQIIEFSLTMNSKKESIKYEDQENVQSYSADMTYDSWNPNSPAASLPKGFSEPKKVSGVKLLNASDSKLDQYFTFNSLSHRTEENIPNTPSQNTIYKYTVTDLKNSRKVNRLTSGNIGLNPADLAKYNRNDLDAARMNSPRIVSFPKKNGIDGITATSFSYTYLTSNNNASSGDSNLFGGSGIVLIAHDSNDIVRYYPKSVISTDSEYLRATTTQMTHFFTNYDNTAMIAFGKYFLTNNGTNVIEVPIRITFDNINGRGRSQTGISFMKPTGMNNNLSLKMGYTTHMDIAGKHEDSQMKSLGSNDGIYFDEKINDLRYYVAFYGQPRGQKSSGLTGIEGMRVYNLVDKLNTTNPENYWTNTSPINWNKTGGSWKKDMYPDKSINDLPTGEVYTGYDYTNNKFDPRIKLTHPGWFFYYPSKQVKQGESLHYGIDMDVTDVPSIGFSSLGFKNNQTNTTENIQDTKFNVTYTQPIDKTFINNAYNIDYLDISIKLDDIVNWENSDFTIKNGATTLKQGTDYRINKVSTDNTKLTITIFQSYLKKVSSPQTLSINQSSKIDWSNGVTKNSVNKYYSKTDNSFTFPVSFENSWLLQDGSYSGIQEEITKTDNVKLSYNPTYTTKENKMTDIPSDSTSDKNNNKLDFFDETNYFSETPVNPDFDWDTLNVNYQSPLPDYSKEGISSTYLKISSPTFAPSRTIKVNYNVLPFLAYPSMKISDIIKTSKFTAVDKLVYTATYEQELPDLVMSKNNQIRNLNLDINIDPNMLQPDFSDFIVKYEGKTISNYKLTQTGSVYSFLFDYDFLNNKKGVITIEQTTRLINIDSKGDIVFSSSELTKKFTDNTTYYSWEKFLPDEAGFWAMKFPVTVNNQWTLFNGKNDSIKKPNKEVSSLGAVRVGLNTNISLNDTYSTENPFKVKPNSVATNEFNIKDIIDPTDKTKNQYFIGPDDLFNLTKNTYKQEPNGGDISVTSNIEKPLELASELKNNYFPWDKSLEIKFYKSDTDEGFPDFKNDKKGTMLLRHRTTDFKTYRTFRIPYEVVSNVKMTVKHVDQNNNLIKKVDMINLPDQLEDVSLDPETVKAGEPLSKELAKIQKEYEGYDSSGEKPIIKTNSGSAVTDDIIPYEDFTVTYKHTGKILMNVTKNIDFKTQKLNIITQKDLSPSTTDKQTNVSLVNTSSNKKNWKLSVKETAPMKYKGVESNLLGTLYFYDKEKNTKNPLINPYSINNNVFDAGKRLTQKHPIIPNKQVSSQKESGIYLDVFPGNKAGTYSEGELTWSLENTP